jgi:hypothetical protein
MHTVRMRTKVVFNCVTCQGLMFRVKSFRVTAKTRDEAVAEMSLNMASWKKSLEGLQCNTCRYVKQVWEY